MQSIRSLGVLAVCLSSLHGASSATPTEDAAACAAKYKDIAPAAMKLTYWEFDQTESGWRKLGSCHLEASQLLARYVKKQEAELRGVRWHLAQTLAMIGENARAAEEAINSLNPDEAKQHPTFSWNTYVQATVAFLRQDRAAFDVQYEAHRLAAAKHPENQINLDVLTGLSKCFDRPYIEAYGSCRSAP
ncbi:hypothetical protein [Roseateles asaccharophilus]|uniref:Uncharacterized protein n=1 Tax=Roseateles asaccharophilus TaxID=582607 RepID=A0ABU2A9P3_9BURK|nr:hypothetical protein [Roseateles asaccharophilus]MDR7333192.1 hypothetical protein [Roseateles asaccharophilus]